MAPFSNDPSPHWGKRFRDYLHAARFSAAEIRRLGYYEFLETFGAKSGDPRNVAGEALNFMGLNGEDCWINEPRLIVAVSAFLAESSGIHATQAQWRELVTLLQQVPVDKVEIVEFFFDL